MTCGVEEKRQIFAFWTIASRLTVPPDAGTVAGIATKALTCGRRVPRVESLEIADRGRGRRSRSAGNCAATAALRAAGGCGAAGAAGLAPALAVTDTAPKRAETMAMRRIQVT